MKFIYSFTRICFFIVSFFLSILHGFGQEDNIGIPFIPDIDQFKNWKAKDSVEVYSGDNLFNYINGGADLYLEYGFKDVTIIKYLNYQAESIKIELYRMDSDSSAFGIFSISSSANGIPVNAGNKGILYDYHLDFWKGEYFVRCIASIKEKSIRDTLQIFAGLVDASIHSDGREPIFVGACNKANPEFINSKYVVGLTGLGNVYNFGHGAIAGFKEGVIGYKGDKILFTFKYDNDFKCREWFASAKGKMQMNRRFTDFVQKDSGFTIKDNKDMISFCFIQLKKYMVIIKGMEWDEGQPVVEQLKLNLN